MQFDATLRQPAAPHNASAEVLRQCQLIGLGCLALPLPAAVTKDYDLLTATDPQRWLVSCYFALTTMVTIGERPPAQQPAPPAAVLLLREEPSLFVVGGIPSLLNLPCGPVVPIPTPSIPCCSRPSPCLPAGYGDITPTTIKDTGVTILFEVVGGGWHRSGIVFGRVALHGAMASSLPRRHAALHAAPS